MGSIKRTGLVTAATMTAFVALVPSALPGHAGAAPATPLSAAVAEAPGQADNRATSASSDGGSAVNLLLAGGAITGIGVLLFVTHQPRPLTKRRRSPG